MFIGYYNKSVILTYLGVFFGVLSMMLAFKDQMLYAHLSLLAAGICDMFDGKVARMCKRNRKEKQFGIEIDSLADTFNFVALPIVLFLCMGYTDWYYAAIYTCFALGGVIRLGYFNVEALSIKLGGPVKYYSGLPVTTTSFIFPFFYIVSFFVDKGTFQLLVSGLMSLIAISFIYNFKIKKPDTSVMYLFLVLAFIITVSLLFIYYR